jgi:hypothetical protein
MSTSYTTPDTYSFPRTLRTTLPDPFYEGGTTDSDSISTGIYLTALYWQPRARRLIARTYSIWAQRDGSHIGERFEEICPTKYGRIALHDWSIEQHMTSLGLLSQVLNSI